MEVYMSKRKLVLSAAMILLSASLSFAKITLELRGAYTLLNPADFNTDYTAALTNPLTFAMPEGAALPAFDSAFQGGASVRVFLGDSFAIFPKFDFIYMEKRDTVQLDNQDAFESHLAVTTAYFGLGAAFSIEVMKGFSLSIGADGGMFMHLNSFWQIFADAGYIGGIAYVSPFTKSQAAAYPLSTVDFVDTFFGGNAELGLHFTLAQGLELNAFGGYRIASSPFVYPDTYAAAAFAIPGAFKATSIDLSGPYFGAGISFVFGDDSKPEQPAQQQKSAAAVSQYETYGDHFYKKKDYASALKYYLAAEKQGSSAGLVKKIGFCYYYTKNIPKALEYLEKYLKLNPDDTQIIRWHQKIRR